jgi:hypothetical protein
MILTNILSDAACAALATGLLLCAECSTSGRLWVSVCSSRGSATEWSMAPEAGLAAAHLGTAADPCWPLAGDHPPTIPAASGVGAAATEPAARGGP